MLSQVSKKAFFFFTGSVTQNENRRCKTQQSLWMPCKVAYQQSAEKSQEVLISRTLTEIYEGA